jgi:hypothetical protein
VFEADLIQRAGDPSTMDLFVGTALVVLVFEATRRILGLALPIVCGLFLLYGLFGQYLPGDLAHRGYGFDQIVDQLALRHRGHLRHPDPGVGDLHLPVHPVRLLPRARRHDQPVQLDWRWASSATPRAARPRSR